MLQHCALQDPLQYILPPCTCCSPSPSYRAKGQQKPCNTADPRQEGAVISGTCVGFLGNSAPCLCTHGFLPKILVSGLHAGNTSNPLSIKGVDFCNIFVEPSTVNTNNRIICSYFTLASSQSDLIADPALGWRLD